MENIMSQKPVYERIIFDRKNKAVFGYTFEAQNQTSYTERYVFKESKNNADKTTYDMYLYKNPGLKKILRFKLHNWGV